MDRADKVLAQVAAGMQDSGVIQEALTDSISASIRLGDKSPILIDIASAIALANQPETPQTQWETVAMRLLHMLERYARAALTANAEDDIAQDDDEDDDQ